MEDGKYRIQVPIQLSSINREAGKRILPYCRMYAIGFVCMKSLAGGPKTVLRPRIYGEWDDV